MRERDSLTMTCCSIFSGLGRLMASCCSAACGLATLGADLVRSLGWSGSHPDRDAAMVGRIRAVRSRLPWLHDSSGQKVRRGPCHEQVRCFWDSAPWVFYGPHWYRAPNPRHQSRKAGQGFLRCPLGQDSGPTHFEAAFGSEREAPVG